MKWDGTIWELGQKRKIAELAGISEQNFSDIVHRIRQAHPDKARALEEASGKVLDEANKIPWEEFLESRKSLNEYFIGEPKGMSKEGTILEIRFPNTAVEEQQTYYRVGQCGVGLIRKFEKNGELAPVGWFCVRDTERALLAEIKESVCNIFY